MSPIVERGGIYLVSTTVILTSILLYLRQVPVWVEAQGNIVLETKNISLTAARPGIVTTVKAKAGQRLAKDATLVEIKPTSSSFSEEATLIQLQKWQTSHQRELENTQSKVIQLELQLKSQANRDKDNPQGTLDQKEKMQALQAEIATIKTELENPLPSVVKDKVIMPQTGTLKQLKVKKVGQQISKNTILATVVPDAERLRVEATIGDRELASIRPGMPAKIKVDNYDFHKFGTLHAQVIEIVPNANRPGESKVVLDLAKTTLTRDKQEILLQPGLDVQVDFKIAMEELWSARKTKERQP